MAATTRAERARAMRFKQPLCKAINWQQILEDLYEIKDACADIRWLEGDEEALLDLFDGDEETAFEFKVACADLAGECERFSNDLDEIRRYDFLSTDSDEGASIFDTFFPAIDKEGGMLGYDDYEEDYYGLDIYERDAAQRSARKRLMRLTKEQLCDLAGTAFRIARNYWGMIYRFDCLKAEIDIIRGQNDHMLKAIKATEAAWETWNEDSKGGKYRSWKAEEDLDRLLRDMPDRVWVE